MSDKMGDLRKQAIKCLIINFDKAISSETDGALLVAIENPFLYFDTIKQEIKDLSSLIKNPEFLRKLMRYCNSQKITLCISSRKDEADSIKQKEEIVKKIKLTGFKIISGEELIFSIIKSVLTTEDLFYLDENFQFGIYHGVNPQTQNKNHLVSKIIKDYELKPGQIFLIDSDFRTVSDAKTEWDGDNNSIKTRHCKPGGLNFTKFGDLIGESPIPAKIV